MSCCERMKIKRLKEFSHANILCSHAAHVTDMKQGLVITNSRYGKYYEIMEYRQIEKRELEAVIFYNPTSRLKKRPKKVAESLA